jgi:hypothetical protein
VNRHQQIALEHHCRLAEETLRPQLRYEQLGAISIVLSVNSGYE